MRSLGLGVADNVRLDRASRVRSTKERDEALLSGNVVISKKFLRTRKIMVMHSNERGECDLRTLVDRQRKR